MPTTKADEANGANENCNEVVGEIFATDALENLRDVFANARRMLESALMKCPDPLPAEEAELRQICGRLQRISDLVTPIIGSSSSTGDETKAKATPRILVLGQPKSGKSSFVNEILGRSVVRQSGRPSAISELFRIRYSTQPSRGSRDSSDGGVLVSEVGLPCELLQRSGVEILDSTGAGDGPPADALELAASPAVVVYVIDAVSGVTREVERDLAEIGSRFSSSQLVLVLNKLDASAEMASGAGVGLAEAEAAMRARVESALQRLGCLTTARLFCLSCRRLRALRRRLRLGGGDVGNGVSDDSVDSLEALRTDIVCGVPNRLRQLLTEAANALLEAGEVFRKTVTEMEDTCTCKEHEWKNLLDLQAQMFGNTGAPIAAAMSKRMCALLKKRIDQIKEAVRYSSDHSDDPERTLEVAEAAIEQLTLNLQVRQCQEFVDSELASWHQHMKDILAALAVYERPLDPSPLPRIQIRFTVSEDIEYGRLDRAPGGKKSKGAGGGLGRSVAQSKPSWRADVAKRFMASIDLSGPLEKSAARLEDQIRKAHRAIQAVVVQANARVKELCLQLRLRRDCLRCQYRLAQQLWLRLRSATAEQQRLRNLRFHRGSRCIAVGAQGSIVFQVPQTDDTSAGVLAVKKLWLDDRQFLDMAGALRLACCAPDDSPLLPIQHLRVSKMPSQPALWKLVLSSELLPQRSLRHRLPQLRLSAPLSDRVRVLLSIAEALGRLHKDRRAHGNLRMSNIFICDDDGRTVKLADMGQLRSLPVPALSGGPETAGETEFPPELMRPSSASGTETVLDLCSADVFCLGSIVRTLLLHSDPSPSPDECSDEIAALVEQCMQQNPSDRPAIPSVVQSLNNVAEKLTIKLRNY